MTILLRERRTKVVSHQSKSTTRQTKRRFFNPVTNTAIHRLLAILAAIVVVCGQAFPQNDPIRLYCQANEYRLLSDFMELLKLPNVASDTENILLNARYIMAEMNERGLRPRLLGAADRRVPPVVYGRWISNNC